MPNIRDSLRTATAPSLMLMRAAEAEIYKLDAEIQKLRRSGDQCPEFTDTSRAGICWLLWHHQASRDPVGTVCRFILGMGENDAMTAHQVELARSWGTLAEHVSGSPADDDTPSGFITWFTQHYHGTVHIGDTAWHGKRIWQQALWYLLVEGAPFPRPMLWTRHLPGFMREYSVAYPTTADWTALYPLRELITVAALQMVGEAVTDEITVPMAPASKAVVREKARLHVQAGRSWRGLWAREVEAVAYMAEYYYLTGWQAAEQFHDIAEEAL